MLTPEELKRYDRQIILKGFGTEAQEKLKRAKVLVAGCGGLGSPALTYLAAAGVGTIRIIDSDTVDFSNLNRQILHWQKDVGRPKVESANEKLTALNPCVKIEPIQATIDESNVFKLTDGCDLIVDAMDNLDTRFLLNRVAIEKKIPFMHGAVYGFEGRAMTVVPGQSACLRCIYRAPIPAEKVPVLGVTPAVIGAIQATEAIKYITGLGKLLTNTLLVYDGLNMRFTELKVKRDATCGECGHLL